jgi:hypothetical protein
MVTRGHFAARRPTLKGKEDCQINKNCRKESQNAPNMKVFAQKEAIFISMMATR